MSLISDHKRVQAIAMLKESREVKKEDDWPFAAKLVTRPIFVNMSKQIQSSI